MTALIGGLVAVALGLISLGFFWKDFLSLLAGTIPGCGFRGGGPGGLRVYQHTCSIVKGILSRFFGPALSIGREEKRRATNRRPGKVPREIRQKSPQTTKIYEA